MFLFSSAVRASYILHLWAFDVHGIFVSNYFATIICVLNKSKSNHLAKYTVIQKKGCHPNHGYNFVNS